MKADHYYDWEHGWTTNSSLGSVYKEKTIRCDGVEVSNVVRCLEGENGFIEFFETGATTVVSGQMKRTFRKGNVDVEWLDREEE